MLNTIAALTTLLTPIEAETVPLPVRLPENARIELMLMKPTVRTAGSGSKPILYTTSSWKRLTRMPCEQ